MSIWKRDCILLGHVGDNQAHDIVVDVSSILKRWPSAYIEVAVLRPGESTPYLADTHVADGKLYWHVNNSDTAIVGYGKAELIAYVDGGIGYTCTVVTKIKPILPGLSTADPPEPAEWWIEQVIGYKAEAVEAAEAAEASATAAASSESDAADHAEAAAESETAAGQSQTAAARSALAASESALAAAESESNAEAWAVGQRDGTDVGNTDETYHNNSKYYSGQASGSASTASQEADAAALAAGAASDAANYAAREASAASGSATDAADYAEDSEAWAVGQRAGTDVPDTDDTYHNNSKYYSQQAATSASDAAHQLELVTAEGTRQIGLVDDAGAAQIAAIDEEGEEVLDSIPADYTQLTNDVTELRSIIFHLDDIPGTTQTVNFGSDGKPSSIVHTASGSTVRTDAFTWGTDTVTETRTLADGSYITFVTNLITLVTTISEIQEGT